MKSVRPTNGPLKIERGVPLPNRHVGVEYPWRDMKVGDSFLLPHPVDRGQIGSLAAVTGKRLGRKFATRKTSDGIRVWRIK